MPHDGQTQGPRGWPNILGLLRATNLRLTGKAGATAGAGLAGGTTSGAPTSGAFDVGDLVIGADGTLFVCTVAGSPGTWVQLGTLVDPLTTRGDLIVRGASSTGRLALGATNYVLTSNGTDAVWGVAPAGSGGALTQISSLNTNSGAAANIDFTSIAGSYSSLLVLGSIAVASTSSADRFLQLVINADSGAHYSYGGSFWNSSTTGFDTGATSATKMVLGEVPLNGSDAGAFAAVVLWIPNYASTHTYKGVSCDLSGGVGATSPVLTKILGNWSQTSAITDLKFSITTGVNLAQFSGLTLYGLT